MSQHSALLCAINIWTCVIGIFVNTGVHLLFHHGAKAALCQSLQVSPSKGALLWRVITTDENWIYSYDPETKQQSSQWKGPQTKMRHTGLFLWNLQGSASWMEDIWCIILNCDVMVIRYSIMTTCPLTAFFGCTKTIIVSILPYSLHLAPCDVLLFPNMKFKLKGCCSDSGGDPLHVTDSAWYVHRTKLSGSVPRVAEVLGTIYSCRRWLRQTVQLVASRPSPWN